MSNIKKICNKCSIDINYAGEIKKETPSKT